MNTHCFCSRLTLSGLLGLALLAVSLPPAGGALVNRYTFDETPGSTIAYDLYAGMDGTLEGTAQFTGTEVNLDGASGLVSLPAGLISGLTDMTIEAWVTWRGGAANQRIFDFGSSDGTSGLSYVALSPSGPGGKLRWVASTNGAGAEVALDGLAALPVGTQVHVAVCYHPSAGQVALYVNGKRVATAAASLPLAAVADTHNVLGKSQYSAHPFLNARLNDLRISDTALTTPEVAASAAGGPAIEAYDPGAFGGFSLVTTNALFSWSTAPAYVVAAYANVSAVDLSMGEGVVYDSSDPNVITVDANGLMTARTAAGAAYISATYGGTTKSNLVNITPLTTATLVHRYSFEETSGSTIYDSIGTAHGTVVNPSAPLLPATTNYAVGGGRLTLIQGGTNPAYVNLPNGLISSLTNGTFECWVTYSNSASWARVFDFGISTGGEDLNNGGVNYIFLAAQNPIRFAYKPLTTGENPVLAPSGYQLTNGVRMHVAVTYDTTAGLAKLFLNGRVISQAATPATNTLRSINDKNNWLGRAQFADPYFKGDYFDFRIYEGPMSEPDVLASYLAGPDTLSTGAGAPTNLVLVLTNTIYNTAQCIVTGRFSAPITNVVITSSPDITYTSSDTNIATVTPTGFVTGRRNGSAVITATYRGQQDSKTITVNLGGDPLVHRYSFSELSGTSVNDGLGGAPGTLLGGATFNGAGQVTLNGLTAFVNLPNGLVSSLSSATLEAWVTWNAGANNQHLFDFGANTGGEDNQGTPTSFVYYTPLANGGAARFTSSEYRMVNGYAPQLSGSQAHVAVTYDGVGGIAKLYLNGRLVGYKAVTLPLSAVSDVNNWLGRSQSLLDPYFGGTINEFRIYRTNLSTPQLAMSASQGPDLPMIGNPGAATALRLSVAGTIYSGAWRPQQASAMADFAGVANVDVSLSEGVQYTSSDTNIITINQDGYLGVVAAGTVTITATYQGLNASKSVTSILGTPGLVLAGSNYVTLTATNPSAATATWTNEAIYSLGNFARAGTPFVNGNVYGTGLPGVSLNGSSDAFLGPAAGVDLAGNSDRSVEVWALNPSLVAEETLVAWSRRGVANSFNMAICYGSTYGIGHWGGTYDMPWTPTTIVPPAGMWHHIVYTYDGNLLASVYVDGALAMTKTMPGPLNAYTNDSINIGAQRSSATAVDNSRFSGFINCVRIHGGTLSAADVAANFAAGPAFVAGPVAISGQPQSLTVAEFGSATFGVSVSGTPPVSYQWYRNGSPILGAVDANYTAFATGADNGAGYSVVVSNFANGVGLAVTSSVATLSVITAGSALVHRYSFQTDASDSIGSADGVLNGGAMVSGGELVLANPTAPPSSGAGAYCDFPNNLVSSLSSITMELWATDAGSGNWARYYDFGTTSSGEGNAATGLKYFLLTVPGGSTTLRAGISTNSNATGAEQNTDALNGKPAVGQKTHLVFALDAPSRTGRLFINGVQVAANTSVTLTPATMGPLYNIWLGRSQWGGDAYFNGRFDEVRIYNAALSPMQVAANYASGPDASVDDFPVRITAQPSGATVGEGASASFRFSARGQQPVTYQWYRNGSPIADATGRFFTTGALLMPDNGAQYVCVASNFVGGQAYTATTAVAQVTVVRASLGLRHRYAFQSDATDSVGTAHGTLMNGATILNGAVNLVAANSNYVDLPGHLLDGYTALTMEFWASVGTNAIWPRIYDFGSQSTNLTGLYYAMFSPHSGAGDGRMAFSDTDPNSLHEVVVTEPMILDGLGPMHVACVYDPRNSAMALYTNGVLANARYDFTSPLAGLSNVYSWLGRSLFAADAWLQGSIDEFRLYDTALSAGKVWQSFRQGPNLPLNENPINVAQQPRNTRAVLGASAGFGVDAVSALGLTPLSYQWRFQGNPIPEATNASLTVPDVQPAKFGNYDVVLNNSGGALTSAVATLSLALTPVPVNDDIGTLQDTPVLFPASLLSGNDVSPDGSSLTVTATATSSTNGGIVGLSAGMVVYTPPAGPVGMDAFTYTVTSAYGASAEGLVLVHFYNYPSQGQAARITVAAGQVVLGFVGQPMAVYRLERATALPGTWQTIGTVTVGMDGLATLTDPNPPASAAYYRLARP